MKESFLFLAEGFEEIEALSAVDILRRAGIAVRMVSITSSLQVKGAHGVTVTADVIFDSTLFKNVDWLILPGGMPGAENLYNFAPLQGLLENHAAKGGNIAAICAAPAVVLGQMGLLKGKPATCYPGFEKLLKGAEVLDKPVVVADNFVLGNGPGNAFTWALAIVAKSLCTRMSNQIAGDMLIYRSSEEAMDNFFG